MSANSTAEKLAEIERFMELLESEPQHVRQVRRLAAQLFEQLAPLHRLGPEDLLVLEAAALLHDIGHSEAEAGRKHHKLSAELIRANRWVTLTAGEAELIACVARYHRKSHPSVEHDEFAGLPPQDQSRVKKLAAMLRIADGLDRGHVQAVRSVRTELEPGRLTLQIESNGDAAIDREGALRKRELFEEVFGLALVAPARE